MDFNLVEVIQNSIPKISNDKRESKYEESISVSSQSLSEKYFSGNFINKLETNFNI
jgi:hypothetical protein